MNLKEKKIAVFGLGISGKALIKYLTQRQYQFVAWDDNIKANDSNFDNFQKNLFPLDHQNWQNFDYLILSPGIPLYYPEPHPVVKLAKNCNAKIICDLEFFYLLNPNKQYIGITGTNGKSTTTSLLSHILTINGIPAIACGNIGLPIFAAPENEIYVIEISSYQLDLLDQMEFDLSILLNITADHIDRHGTLENYVKAKLRIFKQISKKVISFNFLEQNYIKQCKNIIDKIVNINLQGEHNQQNIVAASLCALEFALKINQIVFACNSFLGLPHRIQFLGTAKGISFINDSKATNSEASANCLAIFDNIIWILGGIAKDGGIENLTKFFPKIKKALLIGQAQNQFSETLGNQVEWLKCKTLENAFNQAIQIAKPGDIVALSPSCSSLDQWQNFEQRGNAFIKMYQKFKEAND